MQSGLPASAPRPISKWSGWPRSWSRRRALVHEPGPASAVPGRCPHDLVLAGTAGPAPRCSVWSAPTPGMTAAQRGASTVATRCPTWCTPGRLDAWPRWRPACRRTALGCREVPSVHTAKAYSLAEAAGEEVGWAPPEEHSQRRSSRRLDRVLARSHVGREGAAGSLGCCRGQLPRARRPRITSGQAPVRLRPRPVSAG